MISECSKLDYIEEGLSNKTIEEDYIHGNLVYYDTVNNVYLNSNGDEIIINGDEDYEERLCEGFSTIFDEE